jgi:hypothetical protein
VGSGTVRCVHKFATVEPLLAEDGSLMGERQEAFLAVIVAHAGIANAAEGQVVLGNVHHGIVDTHTAGMGTVGDVFLL